jgi:hypothetical protein
MNEINSEQLQCMSHVKGSTLVHIFLLNIEKLKQINPEKNSSERNTATQKTYYY